MKSLYDIIGKYASVGMGENEVLEQYTKIKTELMLKEGLRGSVLETKVYKIMEDRFLELLEKVVNNEN